ncbi:MAG: hypothetical protein HQ504_03480 [Rhodospirillaceae bacterium]|nr:hypothetical protein [Rhodospirillaceae bacterium]
MTSGTKTKHDPLRKGVFAALALLLGACSAAQDNIPLPCPKTTVLADASSVTRFINATGRDIIDIDFEGTISGLSGSCAYNIDEDTGEGVINLEARPEFKISRGAANKTRQVEFLYFASLVDAEGQVIEKQTFPFALKFKGNKTTIVDEDAPLELTIPVKFGQSGDDFNILVGFQISREELEYNRAKWRQ